MTEQAETQVIIKEQETFNRPPRIWLTPTAETLKFPIPPAKEAIPPAPGLMTLVAPLIMMGALFALYGAIYHGNIQQLVFLLPMVLFSVMTPLMGMITGRQKGKSVLKKQRADERQYRKVLKALRKELEVKAMEQRQFAWLKDPGSDQLEARIKERKHLWERRPDDPDFLAVRVGTGPQPFFVQIEIPEIESSEPLLPDIQQFERDFSTVSDIPCSISLPHIRSLGITGARQDVADFIRSFFSQIATHHSPEDVRILGIYPASQKRDWDWMRDLPHTAPLRTAKLDRLVAVGQEEAIILLNFLLEELSQRATKDDDEQNAANAPQNAQKSEQPPPLPHLVVFVHDYVDVRKHPALTYAFKFGEHLSVSVIYMVAQQSAIPSECRGIVRLYHEQQEAPTTEEPQGAANSMALQEQTFQPLRLQYVAAGYAGETLENVTPDSMELASVGRVAKALSPLQVIEGGEDAVNLPSNVRILDMYELGFADQFDPDKWWYLKDPLLQIHARYGRLRVPMGQGLNGLVWLDLNDTVHGPHGIIAGTTGSGKSELLQSLILGLAMTHHPHLVNFVLVDFKGGATFKPFEKLPHTVGIVTDLSGRLTERALTALKSELRRREHMLSEANAKKIAQYQAMRAQALVSGEAQDPNSPFREPLPNLMIIIDEFAELAKEHPEFMDGLVSVVQKGRSLGVHLILATQKPTGSVNPAIWSNLKFRICLRVASLQDSRDMIGRSEAALLPSTQPGRAYLQIGSEVFELFQSARTSLPAKVQNESIISMLRAAAGAEDVTDQMVLSDLMVPFKDTIGAELFRPWPDPLPKRISLAEIYENPAMPPVLEKKPLSQALTSGIGADLSLDTIDQPVYGWLNTPIGLVDLPAEQRQEPLMLNMPQQGGHILIAGAPGTGKSVFLRTLITSLALTHTSSQLQMYMVDFGGQALKVFEKLPHVGGIFGEADDEYIRRLLRKLLGTIEERKHLFATQQIEDFLMYQRRRNDPMHATTHLPELPAVVLLIDKFLEFKQAHDKDMDLLLSLARQGRNYGVYLVLTVDRPIAVPTQLLSLIEIRFGLRLLEVTDSLILLGRYEAARIDAGMAGRAYRRGNPPEEVQVALPVRGEDDDEVAAKLEEYIDFLAHEAEGTRAPAIELLPDYVRIDDFLIEAAFGDPLAQQNGLRLRLGIEDLSLRPIALDLNADTPHAIVAGGPVSGKTNVLQACLLTLGSAPTSREVQVILVDFRRSSRALRRLPNVWMYADSEERLLEVVETLKKELRERMDRMRAALEEKQNAANDNDDALDLDMQPILLVIDDYDQLGILTKNPLNDLKEYLLQARNLNLHMIVAAGSSDLSRNDIVLQQARSCRMGVILGGDPADSPLLGVRMSDMPPGRGYLVRRNQRYLVQIAHLKPEMLRPWVARLTYAAMDDKVSSILNSPALPD
ncbi:MAG: type VII secretion protein EssC [Ktedonobacteraceae bacterium]|nr:type VII secretion protein EssC [Chloroflexota bacterium]